MLSKILGATAVALLALGFIGTKASAGPSDHEMALDTGHIPQTQADVTQGDGKKARIGEFVRFPSGGPLMKVTGIRGDIITCQWMTEGGQLVSGTFPAAAITSAVGPALKAPEEEHYIYKPCPSDVAINGKVVCLF